MKIQNSSNIVAERIGVKNVVNHKKAINISDNSANTNDIVTKTQHITWFRVRTTAVLTLPAASLLMIGVMRFNIALSANKHGRNKTNPSCNRQASYRLFTNIVAYLLLHIGNFVLSIS